MLQHNLTGWQMEVNISKRNPCGKSVLLQFLQVLRHRKPNLNVIVIQVEE
jgi:hypothetical protein